MTPTTRANTAVLLPACCEAYRLYRNRSRKCAYCVQTNFELQPLRGHRQAGHQILATFFIMCVLCEL